MLVYTSQVDEAPSLAQTLSQLNLAGTGYCASLNFRRTARAITRMYDTAMQAGVRSTQFAILVAVAKTQPVPMGRLAEVLILDPTTLTRSLRLLQKDKLITISKRSAMRQRFVELTPQGEKELARTLPLWREVHARFVSIIGMDEWGKMQRELEGLARTTIALEQNQGDAGDRGAEPSDSVNP